MFSNIVACCGLTTFIMCVAIIVQHDISDKAPESQFAENNSTTLYPVQPISTWTNIGYAFNSGVALAHFIKYPKFHSFPYLLVSIWALTVSMFSGLFHASAGYGQTGNLDVSSIFPYIVSIVWFELHTLLLIYQGHCNRLRNIPNNYFRSCEPPCGKCGTIIFNFMFFLITIGLFFMEYDKVINIPWTSKLAIFGTSILVLFILGVGIVFYSTYKGYLRRGHVTIKYKQHLLFIGFMILLIGAFIAIGLTSKVREHGFISHLATSTAISIILIYSGVVYDNLLRF